MAIRAATFKDASALCRRLLLPKKRNAQESSGNPGDTHCGPHC
jgi:hypothetical protein